MTTSQTVDTGIRTDPIATPTTNEARIKTLSATTSTGNRRGCSSPVDRATRRLARGVPDGETREEGKVEVAMTRIVMRVIPIFTLPDDFLLAHLEPTTPPPSVEALVVMRIKTI